MKKIDASLINNALLKFVYSKNPSINPNITGGVGKLYLLKNQPITPNQNNPNTPLGVIPKNLNHVSPATILSSQAITIKVNPNLNVSVKL